MLKEITLLQNYKFSLGVFDGEKKKDVLQYISWGNGSNVQSVKLKIHWWSEGLSGIVFKVILNGYQVYRKPCWPLQNCNFTDTIDVTEYINNGKNLFTFDVSKAPWEIEWGNVYCTAILNIEYEGKQPNTSNYPPYLKYVAGAIAGAAIGSVIVIKEGKRNEGRSR